MVFAITKARFVRGVVGSHNVLVDEKPQIAFVGRSNVGKSRVINALTGRRDLVRSSSTPGKTQQLNYFLINDRVYFVDVPGYGYAASNRKVREKLRRLILWYLLSTETRVTLTVIIIDAKVGLREWDREIMAVLRQRRRAFLVVANKVDKINQKELCALRHAVANEVGADTDVIAMSARTSRGIDALRAAIARSAQLEGEAHLAAQRGTSPEQGRLSSVRRAPSMASDRTDPRHRL